MTEKCPKCQREWKGQAPCDQTVCIEMFGECIPCRFLPTTHPNNTRGSGSGTEADLKAIAAASKVARAKVGAGDTAVQGDMLLPANVELRGPEAALSPEAPSRTQG